MFMRCGVFVAHDCEVATPSKFLTVQIGAYPVVIVRGRDDIIRAFHNTCRHRGLRVCSGDHGKVKPNSSTVSPMGI